MHIVYISLVYAIGFGILETIVRQLDYYYFNINPSYKYTTFTQFIITFCYSPFIIYHKKLIKSKFIQYLLFPLNIYLCEIIFGNLLLYYDYRAWHYTDNLALFNNTITIYYYPVWILLYFIENLFYNRII